MNALKLLRKSPKTRASCSLAQSSLRPVFVELSRQLDVCSCFVELSFPRRRFPQNKSKSGCVFFSFNGLGASRSIEKHNFGRGEGSGGGVFLPSPSYIIVNLLRHLSRAPVFREHVCVLVNLDTGKGKFTSS